MVCLPFDFGCSSCHDRNPRPYQRQHGYAACTREASVHHGCGHSSYGMACDRWRACARSSDTTATGVIRSMPVGLRLTCLISHEPALDHTPAAYLHFDRRKAVQARSSSSQEPTATDERAEHVPISGEESLEHSRATCAAPHARRRPARRLPQSRVRRARLDVSGLCTLSTRQSASPGALRPRRNRDCPAARRAI